jgi:hypothetical protein
MHDQVQGPLPATELGVPIKHNPVTGAVCDGTPLETPQCPEWGLSGVKEKLTGFPGVNP